MDESDTAKYEGFQQLDFEGASQWKQVQVPHNWDQYAGYRRQLHGNLHGYAWYRKTFELKKGKNDTKKRYYLFFEGVGSYATVWLNEKRVGYHAGGRTTFTIDVTDVLFADGRPNVLAVRADHPADIRDLPWVDGGCSPERGFSEGSQPLGIFRPVTLIIKNEVNIEPFGVHVWNDENIRSDQAVVHHTVEVKNNATEARDLRIDTRLKDHKGRVLYSSQSKQAIAANTGLTLKLKDIVIKNPTLWSPEQPYLYTIETIVKDGKRVLDQETVPYGIRKISWPKGLKPNGTNQLFVNDKPVFIHGIAEYEHKLGNSHAFADEEISARVREMKSLGFNSFRDAHQPHNLRYQQFWDENGILLWTQMAAHIWFDNDAFRENFKNLLRDWVKERRNSPSVFLWGLENESTLPEDFAKECTAIIRELDPTASIQRLVTTCNGGSGTDWDVPQNWTGTYGGHHNTYGEDLKRQVLVGEYGAWRSLELHSEGPYLPNHNEYSEERFSEILQTKIRLADSVKEESIGHYLWLWNSHDNPGRVQGGEGFRDLDKIGPVNYKGILTPWGEPLDAYYMYRSHYASKEDPMVYIAMHTWPNRWIEPGLKNNIRIYSNCDEVELFNDVDNRSLGKLANPGLGRHFEFNNVDIQYNVLLAEGRIGGQVVARDTIILHHLPKSPHFTRLVDKSELLKGDVNQTYLYRVNCGGDIYVDAFGQTWAADQPYTSETGSGSRSWADNYQVNSYFASQRRTFDPIKGVEDWALFQTFRYGQDKLAFEFDVENGEYLVELYFAEPWIGTGGIADGTGWRLFDVAINDNVIEDKLDIWKEVGHDKALKRSYKILVDNGKIIINFPRVYSNQALIQAIAIAKRGTANVERKSVHFNIKPTQAENLVVNSWMDIDSSFQYLPSFLYGSDYFRTAESKRSFTFNYPTNFYVISKAGVPTYENTGDSVVMHTGEKFLVSRRIVDREEVLTLPDAGPEAIYAFQVQSGLQPAYDLKETSGYKANQSTLSEQMTRVDFQGQERLQYMERDCGFVGWEIQVGVADIYALTFKYHNASKEAKSGFYEVLAKDGAILKPKTAVTFEPTREGKWNYLDENTSTMINAGTYIVKLYAADAKDVYVDNLDVR
ncbi:hypothetical protein GCM10011418_09000 [Sphingobacterium alkalisoli]|nr:hypothetical protein GCM10011418_09000 [Sphingobacterium alkalisoli]